MADEELTHFRFDFGGIKLEVSGEREFVREMYHRVMQDVEKARNANLADSRSVNADGSTLDKKSKIREPSVWVHRCSDLMRKIYMLTYEEFKKTPLVNFINLSRVRNIYLDKGIFDEILPETESNQTLWAEFTRAGKNKIAEVTQPASKSYRASKSQ